MTTTSSFDVSKLSPAEMAIMMSAMQARLDCERSAKELAAANASGVAFVIEGIARRDAFLALAEGDRARVRAFASSLGRSTGKRSMGVAKASTSNVASDKLAKGTFAASRSPAGGVIIAGPNGRSEVITASRDVRSDVRAAGKSFGLSGTTLANFVSNYKRKVEALCA